MAAAEGVADEAGVGGEVLGRGEFPAFQLGVDRGLHRSRIGERGVGDVEQGGGRGEFFGGGDEGGPGFVIGRARGEVLHRAFEEPEADDIGERPIAAVANALVGDTGGESFGAQDRFIAFEADEGPRAGAEEEIGPVGRRGHRIVGGGGVVAGDGDDLHAGELGEVFHRAEAGAGFNRLGEPLGRKAKVLQRGGRPVGGVDIEELARAGDGEFVLHAAGEKEIKIVGQKEAARREVGDGRAAGDGFFEVERGVVENVGDAGGGVDAGKSGAGVGEAFEAGLRAGVTVRVDGEDQTTGVIDESEIDAPHIDADRGEFRAAGRAATALRRPVWASRQSVPRSQ